MYSLLQSEKNSYKNIQNTEMVGMDGGIKKTKPCVKTNCELASSHSEEQDKERWE